MDFSLSEEQQLVIKTTRDFVHKELYPHEKEVEETGVLRAELHRELKAKAIDAGAPDAAQRHLRTHLSGTLASDRGKAQIETGKVSGDEISFSLLRRGNGDEITVNFSGKVEGATMKLKMQYGRRQPVDVEARRVS